MADDGALGQVVGCSCRFNSPCNRIADNPWGRAQCQWGGQAPLLLPGLAPAVDHRTVVHRRGGGLVPHQEVHVCCLVNGLLGDQPFAEPPSAAAQDRPSQGQIEGLFLTQYRIVLGYAKEDIELRQLSWMILKGIACRRLGLGALGSNCRGHRGCLPRFLPVTA